jgi:hypothetical protein
MGEPDSGLSKLTVRKATCSSCSTPQGRASLAEWEPKVPLDAWNRAASLLGLTAEAEDCA